MLFCKKNAVIKKIKRVMVLKGIFPETIYVYLCIKFQASSIIWRFLDGVILTPSLSHSKMNP